MGCNIVTDENGIAHCYSPCQWITRSNGLSCRNIEEDRVEERIIGIALLAILFVLMIWLCVIIRR